MFLLYAFISDSFASSLTPLSDINRCKWTESYNQLRISQVEKKHVLINQQTYDLKSTEDRRFLRHDLMNCGVNITALIRSQEIQYNWDKNFKTVEPLALLAFSEIKTMYKNDIMWYQDTLEQCSGTSSSFQEQLQYCTDLSTVMTENRVWFTEYQPIVANILASFQKDLLESLNSSFNQCKSLTQDIKTINTIDTARQILETCNEATKLVKSNKNNLDATKKSTSDNKEILNTISQRIEAVEVRQHYLNLKQNCANQQIESCIEILGLKDDIISSIEKDAEINNIQRIIEQEPDPQRKTNLILDISMVLGSVYLSSQLKIIRSGHEKNLLKVSSQSELDWTLDWFHTLSYIYDSRIKSINDQNIKKVFNEYYFEHNHMVFNAYVFQYVKYQKVGDIKQQLETLSLLKKNLDIYEMLEKSMTDKNYYIKDKQWFERTMIQMKNIKLPITEVEAPFGLKWGMSLDDFICVDMSQFSQQGFRRCEVRSEQIPQGPTLGTEVKFSYQLIFHDTKGLQKIEMLSQPTKKDSMGITNKNMYFNLKKKISEKYSEPQFSTEYQKEEGFNECLAFEHCGKYNAVWSVDEGNGGSIELNILSVTTFDKKKRSQIRISGIRLTYISKDFEIIVNQEIKEYDNQIQQGLDKGSF